MNDTADYKPEWGWWLGFLGVVAAVLTVLDIFLKITKSIFSSLDSTSTVLLDIAVSCAFLSIVLYFRKRKFLNQRQWKLLMYTFLIIVYLLLTGLALWNRWEPLHCVIHTTSFLIISVLFMLYQNLKKRINTIVKGLDSTTDMSNNQRA